MNEITEGKDNKYIRNNHLTLNRLLLQFWGAKLSLFSRIDLEPWKLCSTKFNKPYLITSNYCSTAKIFLQKFNLTIRETLALQNKSAIWYILLCCVIKMNEMTEGKGNKYIWKQSSDVKVNRLVLTHYWVALNRCGIAILSRNLILWLSKICKIHENKAMRKFHGIRYWKLIFQFIF